MKSEVPVVRQPSWSGVFLVCKACGKRSNAPKHLDAKTVVAAIRRASKASRSRARVVQTTCLGLCPKKAIAVAAAGQRRPTRIVAVRSASQLDEAIEGLTKEGSVDGQLDDASIVTATADPSS